MEIIVYVLMQLYKFMLNNLARIDKTIWAMNKLRQRIVFPFNFGLC